MSEVIDSFFIHKELGSGSDGRVFEVSSRENECRYALKLLNDQVDPSPFQRTLGYRHPHLISPLRIGRTKDGQHYLLFPLIKQTDARDLVYRLGPPAAFSVLIQAASALSFIHSHGMIHGDIKPENILIDTPVQAQWPHLNLFLSDWEGLAKDNVRSGRVRGTLGYMAKELLDGGEPSSATDVFSLGVWLYWLLTGQNPLLGATIDDSLRRLQHVGDLAPPGRLDGRYSTPFWSEICKRAISPVGQRFEDGTELIRFATEHSPFEDLNGGIPGLLWNPYSLLPEEQDLIERVRDHFRRGDSHAGLLVIRCLRPHSSINLFERLCDSDRVEPTSAVVLTPESVRKRVTDQVLSHPGGTVVIDNTSLVRGFEREDIIDILKTHRVANLGIERQGSVILLEKHDSHTTTSRLTDRVAGWIMNEFVAHVPTPSSYGRWFVGLFSGCEVATDFETRLGLEIVTGDAKRWLLVKDAVEEGALICRNGRITLDEMSSFEPRKRIENLAGDDLDLSHVSLAYLDMLSRLPFGLSKSSRTMIHQAYPPSLQSEKELVAVGKARLGPDASLHLTETTVWDRLPLTTETSTLVQRIISPLLTTMNSRVSNCEAIALEVMALQPIPRYMRRALALAKRLLAQGMPGAALSFMQSIPESCTVVIRARWLDIRSCIWRALDEEKRADIDSIASIGHYESAGCFCLGARVCIRLAARMSGTSKWKEARHHLDHAERLLDRVESRCAKRLQAILLAERGQLARLEGDLKASTTISQRLIASEDACYVSKAMAYRILAANELQYGDQAEIRDLFCKAVIYSRRSRDPMCISRVLNSVATHEFARGYYEKSARISRRILSERHWMMRSTDVFAALSGLGGCAYEMGQFRDALAFNSRSLASSIIDCDARRQRGSSNNVGLLLHVMDKLGESVRILSEAMDIEVADFGGYSLETRMTLAHVLLDVGDFIQARSLLGAVSENRSQFTSFFRYGHALRAQSKLEELSGNLTLARGLAVMAEDVFKSLDAADEIIETRLRILFIDLGYPDRDKSLIRQLQELESGALAIGSWRLRSWARFGLLRWEERSNSARLVEINDLLRDCFERGYGLLDLPLLELKATLLITSGSFLEAQDVLRTALDRIRTVASGFRDEKLRRIYLGDPRRQVFLDLIRKSKGS